MLPLIPIASALISYVPQIAKWVGGDKAEEAASKVMDIAKTVTGANDPIQAKAMIAENPELQQKFILAVENNRTTLDKAYLLDRQDARSHHKHSIFPAILCGVLTIGLMVFITALIYKDIPAENMRLIDTVFGSYLTAWIGSCGYWNGTTRGSAEKNIKR